MSYLVCDLSSRLYLCLYAIDILTIALFTVSCTSNGVLETFYTKIHEDWLRRERFVFLGWSGLMLFPTAYLAS